MSLTTLFSEHFWLLFAVAVSIAVLRELYGPRDKSSSSNSNPS
ncbi:hypothetical protein [Pseudomonas sp. Ga0074129]|jgi:hypothetical protein|nr:hypothetical protein [Pseudomonas sp. Ga0074129]